MDLNHNGWNEIFSKLPIVEEVNKHGYFDITASEIKKLTSEKREARLMAKIDFREKLPPIMAAENLAMLAITNGTYRIGRFNPFIDIQTSSKVKPKIISFPNNIFTLNPKDLKGESAALDAALLSGALSDVFGEKVALTIRGRTRNSPFNFTLNKVKFPVNGVQIEVDGGYEGHTTVNLVEAKIGSPTNLSIRQLLYPQMVWDSIIGGRKTVRTFICLHAEPILRFIPIIYSDETCIADHANEVAFILEPPAKLDIRAIKSNPNSNLPVLGVPFPQANRFETVLAMFNVLSSSGDMTKDELISGFDVKPDPRHVDYYFNAMRWLGLVELENGIIKLTSEGKRIAAMSHAERMDRLAEIIFSEPIFNFVLHNHRDKLPLNLFDRWQCGSESTQQRRLDTVGAWISYFENYTNGLFT